MQNRTLLSARTAITSPAWPKGADGRMIIPVRALLEWAFGVECASLDYDQVGETACASMPGVGQEYRIMQQLALGQKHGEGVRVDTSFGRSLPHDDAEITASILRNSVPWWMATRVAELARAGTAPVWDLGPQRLEPKVWAGRGRMAGQYGKTEVLQTIRYRSRRGMVEREVLWVPCVWVPGVARIASARRAYLDWWGALHAVRSGLKAAELERYVVSDRMPDRKPWEKRS